MPKIKKEKKVKSIKSKRKIIKLIVTLVVVSALVVCGILFIPSLLNKDADSESTLQKRTAIAIEGDVVKTIGSSAPLESSKSSIYKPGLSGEIVEISIEEGDFVLTGDTIMVLDTSNTDDTIESLESQVESKNDQIADKEDLIEEKLKSIEDKQEDIADKRDDITDIKIEISDVEDEIDNNEDTRSDLNVYAPINGSIFDIKVSVGDNINSNTIFATVTDTVSYEVELPFSAKILDEEIQDVKVFYKNNRMDSEIISIADYTYKDRFGNEMVDILLSFTTNIALPEKDVVEGTVYLEFLSYHSKSDELPYYADTESIKSDATGEILELFLVEKQTVSAGDLVAIIDGETIDNATESLEIQVESLEDQITNINETIETYYENIDSYYDDIADINDDIADLIEDISDINDSIEEEKEGYETANIIAEYDGIISGLKVAIGDSVNTNTNLFTLVSLETPSMVVAIDELDIAQLEIGQEAEIVIDALTNTEATPVTAIVTNIAMEGNYQGGVTTFDVTVKLLDPVDGLKLSMNATATIYIDKSEDTLYIPIEAVTIQGGKSYVYVADESATSTPVENQTLGNDSAESGQQPAGGQQGSGGRAPGSKFNTENMTEEQKAAMEERLAANGMNLEDVQGQAQSDSESVSDIADYYMGTRLVEVSTGIYNELYIEILSGLELGDVVVLPPLYTSASSTTTESATNGMMIPGIGTGQKTTGGTGQRPAGGFGGN